VHLFIHEEFDACVDLMDGDIAPGMSPHAAVDAVREALESLPGAYRISVYYYGVGVPRKPPEGTIRIWERGRRYPHRQEARIALIVSETCRVVLART